MSARYPPDAVVSVAPHQLSTTLGDEVVVLGLLDSVYYGLDGVGARVWALIQTPRTISSLLDVIVAEYDVTRGAAETDLEALLSDLDTRGLVAISAATDRA